MKFIVFFCFFVLPLGAFAYPKKALDMTEYEYRRYVRPQLKSILQDYQTLLILLNPEFKPLKKTFSNAKELLKQELLLPERCSGVKVKTCLLDLQHIKTVLDSMISESQQKINLENKEYLSIEEKIKAQDFYTTYKQLLFKAQINLDNILLQSQLSEQKSIFLKILKNDLDNATTAFYMFTTQASDNRFKNDLNNYWVNFIMPVYKYILIKDQKQYFLDNISELNIRWNTLNVRLSKRNKVVSKQVKTLVNIMHNRWNNILKVSLNPMKF